jgi:alcohol dehydrogenase (cytochrome c)
MRIKLPIRLMVAVVMVCVGMAGAIYLAIEYSDLLPSKRILHAMSWRAQLFFRKATGNVQDLSWIELWELSRPAGGFGLESMIVYGESAIAAVSNIYVSRENQEAGAIFNNRCAICHGANGGGISGPPLTRSGLKNGDTDLEIYRVLRDGVAGTAMASPKLSFVERWQIISFIRKLETNTAFGDTRLSPRDVRVSTEQIQASDKRPDEWLTYSGSLSGQRYTALTDITPANVFAAPVALDLPTKY